MLGTAVLCLQKPQEPPVFGFGGGAVPSWVVPSSADFSGILSGTDFRVAVKSSFPWARRLSYVPGSSWRGKSMHLHLVFGRVWCSL